MNYRDVLAHLDALQMHKIKLGLGAMEDFLRQVGRPEKQMKFVHVAGTNGKGSVCATMSEVLNEAGYKIGVYTSPHLSSVRERFRIGRRYIEEECFARIGKQIIDVLAGEQITYFEFTTALALLWFLEEKVVLVLLETGLGGRLDATNVVTPLMSIITSISMDHEMYLGNTLEKIAGEKAGIIKASVPVVAASSGAVADGVLSDKAHSQQAPLYLLGRDFQYQLNGDSTWDWSGGAFCGDQQVKGLQSSRTSLVQQENDSLAIAALQLLRKNGFNFDDHLIRQGIREVHWPGRMEYIELPATGMGDERDPAWKKERYLLDGAHNPAGVKNLANTLRDRFQYKHLIAIWGSMADKDIGATLETISPFVDQFILTRPQGERSAAPELIEQQLPQSLRGQIHKEANVAKSLSMARELADEGDLILVAGSLYLLGEIRTLLLGELA